MVLRGAAWAVTRSRKRLALRSYTRDVAGNGAWLMLRRDARVVNGNRTRRGREARRVTRNRRRLTWRGNARVVGGNRTRRRGKARRVTRNRCRCHALPQIKLLTAHIDVRHVLQAVAAYERLHDMAVGTGVVIDATEASQSRAVERDRLLAAVAMVGDVYCVGRSRGIDVRSGAAICCHGARWYL